MREEVNTKSNRRKLKSGVTEAAYSIHHGTRWKSAIQVTALSAVVNIEK